MKQTLRIGLAAAWLFAVAGASADDALFNAGKASFDSKCAICHTIDKSAGHATGPNLSGVLGRKVGSASGFAYSAALSPATGDWDAARLGAFLQNPQAFAPGNVMPFAGLKNEKERQAVVCFLSGQAGGPACAM
jgi:cytochrome c